MKTTTRTITSIAAITTAVGLTLGLAVIATPPPEPATAAPVASTAAPVTPVPTPTPEASTAAPVTPVPTPTPEASTAPTTAPPKAPRPAASTSEPVAPAPTKKASTPRTSTAAPVTPAPRSTTKPSPAPTKKAPAPTPKPTPTKPSTPKYNPVAPTVTLASWKCLQSGTKVQFVWKFSGGGDYIGPRGVFVAHGQTYLHTTTDTITPGEFINGGLSWYAIHPVTNVTIGHGLAIADAAAGKTCS